MRGLVLTVAAWASLAAGVPAQEATPQPTPSAGATALAAESAAPVSLSVSDYVVALDGLRAHLEAGRLREARGAAGILRGRTIDWSGETLAPDPTILTAVEDAETPAEGREVAARIRRLTEALRADPGTAEVSPRPEVLAQVAPGPDIAKGGETPRLQVKPLTFPERVEAALIAAADWLGDRLRQLGEWLRRLIPERARPEPEDSGTTATVAVIFAGVVAAFLVILALRTLRKDAVDPVQAVSTPVAASSRDEDPLSREASGWEGHARDLAAKRRWREAIRAWYHAVLVTLFRSGLLHHQRGRTNWEYVAQLSPDLRWRRGFMSLTRAFDREWYGRRTSDGEAFSRYAREAQEVLRAVQGAGEGR